MLSWIKKIVLNYPAVRSVLASGARATRTVSALGILMTAGLRAIQALWSPRNDIEIELQDLPRRNVVPARVSAARRVVLLLVLLSLVCFAFIIVSSNVIVSIGMAIATMKCLLLATLSAHRLRAERDGYSYLPLSIWMNNFDPAHEIFAAFKLDEPK